MNPLNFTVVKGQFRCPLCRHNVNGVVRVNKYRFHYPHVCEVCVNMNDAQIEDAYNRVTERIHAHQNQKTVRNDRSRQPAA